MPPQTFRHHKHFQQSSRIQKSAAFLYTNSENNSIAIASTIKYLGMNKRIERIYNKNYKLQRKKLKTTSEDGQISHAHELAELIL
jgi:hypothetical protein